MKNLKTTFTINNSEFKLNERVIIDGYFRIWKIVRIYRSRKTVMCQNKLNGFTYNNQVPFADLIKR